MTWKLLLLTLLLQSVVDATAPTCATCEHYIAGVGFLPHDVYCRVYIQCFESPLPGGDQGTVMCCKEGMYWDQTSLTCLSGTPPHACTVDVPDGICPTVKPVVPPATCLLEEVVGDNTVYYEPSSNKQMPCAPGTVFSLIHCTCIKGYNPPPAPCYDIVKFEFTNDYNSYSCNTEVVGTAEGDITLQDGAACLDGHGDYMHFNYFNNFFAPNLNVKSPYGDHFSYAAWARKRSDSLDFGGLLCNGDCNVDWSYCLGLYNDVVSAGIFGVGEPNQTSIVTPNSQGLTLNDDQWHHYAVTYNGNTMKIYFDGGFLDEIDISGGIRNVQAASTIGLVTDRNETTGEEFYYFFRGCIDDATYFLKTLDAVEVEAIYNATRSV